MIAKEGYPVETHTVITEDCYILQMHRIPFGKKSPKVKGEEPRPAVYLQHGLLSSSTDWVMGAPEKYLGKVSWVHRLICSVKNCYFFITKEF
jgi:lysosomal acid lipase/cholesteryl ester hydrolase